MKILTFGKNHWPSNSLSLSFGDKKDIVGSITHSLTTAHHVDMLTVSFFGLTRWLVIHHTYQALINNWHLSWSFYYLMSPSKKFFKLGSSSISLSLSNRVQIQRNIYYYFFLCYINKSYWHVYLVIFYNNYSNFNIFI